jgi:hypothetical protein
VRVELTFEEEGREEDSEGEVYTKELITPLMVQVKTLRGRRSAGTRDRSTGTRDRSTGTRDRSTGTRDRSTGKADRSTSKPESFRKRFQSPMMNK